MSLAVAGVSLLIAGLGVVKLVSPAVESWSDGKEIALGAAVVGTIVSGYFLAVWRARAGAVGVTPEG
jgi:high-affinity nickel-transport protein